MAMRFIRSMVWIRTRLAAAAAEALHRAHRPLRAVVGFLLFLPCLVSTAIAAGWSPDRAAEADRIIARFLERINAEGGLPKASLALAIGKRGQLFTAKGYGEAAPGVPATAETVYHVGSLAKQFTAAAVLDLVARKATLRDGTPITLDLALARIFDGVEHWPGVEAKLGAQPITLRSLLTMTSNLPNFTRDPPASTNPWGRIGAPELLSELKKLKPSGWPNTFEYSNTSYFLLAEAIEQAILPGGVMPRGHHDYLRETIFDRAGLDGTGFVDSYAAGAALAQPIHRKAPVFNLPNWLKGSADVASSAADLFRWNTAFMEGRVLPPDYSALMISDGARVSPEIYYGMGWFVEHRYGGDVFSHTGQVPGFTAINMIATERGSPAWTSVTVLVNTDVPDGLALLGEELLRLARAQ